MKFQFHSDEKVVLKNLYATFEILITLWFYDWLTNKKKIDPKLTI